MTTSARQKLAEEMAKADGHIFEDLPTDGKPNWQEVYLHAADTAIESEAREEGERTARTEAQIAKEASHAPIVDMPEEPYGNEVVIEAGEHVVPLESMGEATEAERERIAAIANGEGEPDGSTTGKDEQSYLAGDGEDDKGAGSKSTGSKAKPKKSKKRKRSGKTGK